MLIYCTNCTAARPPDSPTCPQCGGTETQETPVAKGTVHNGPSNIQADRPIDPVIDEVAEPEAPAANATTEEWAAYADALAIEVPDGAGRGLIQSIVAIELAERANAGGADDDE